MTGAPVQPIARRRRVSVARVAALTLLLGGTVVASWVAVVGLGVFRGPGPFLHPSWWLTWAVQGLLAGGLLAAIEAVRPSRDARTLAAVVVMAWIGELLVLIPLTVILSDDLRPFHAPWVWLIATGGPIQPVAALLGGLVGRRVTKD